MYHIALLADNSHIDGLLAIINSIIINIENKDKLKNIMFNILIYENKNKILNIINNKFNNIINYRIEQFQDYPTHITFLKNNIRVRGGKKFKYIANIMNFARFYLTKIFNDIDICLYLDTDMIVQTDIFNLFDKYYPKTKEEIDKFYVASPLIMDLEMFGYDKNLNMTGKGFNAGINLINFEKWKQNDYTKQIEDIIMKNKNNKNKLYNLGTQPIMNLIYHNKCTDMDEKWNVRGLGHTKVSENKIKNAFILHWNGKYKPWMKDGMNIKYWIKYKI